MLIAEPIGSEAAASDKLFVVISARWKKNKLHEDLQLQTVDPPHFTWK